MFSKKGFDFFGLGLFTKTALLEMNIFEKRNKSTIWDCEILSRFNRLVKMIEAENSIT